ncbi:MAG: glycine betaine ABC transporter substrate-binding protein [Myxococcaceae bacterium]|nr:glycine betaine ABC transporter substrate-binding protein [Myxococcaceae bacterium]
MIAALVLTASLNGTVVIGSKMDVEGQVLGELFAQVIEATGEATVERRFAMGGTAIVFAALDSGAIDLFPEYSGTLAHVVLRDPTASDFDDIKRRTEARGYLVGPALGFNNTYGLGLKRETARRLGVTRVSELVRHAGLRAGFSPEFFAGAFGWPAVQRRYGLTAEARSMDHVIAYTAMAEGEIDLTDVYTTDAVIAQQDLVVLEDDQHVFSRYEGLALAKADFATRFPKSWAALQVLAGQLTDEKMIELNGRAQLRREPASIIARDVLVGFSLGVHQPVPATRPSTERRWWALTVEHLSLVGVSLLASLLVGLPLGILAARRRWLRQLVVGAAGVLQTVPAIALLCFLIPAFGVGRGAALAALFLYGLLPIVRGVVTGVESIDPALLEVATVLGLPPLQRLVRIELPLASVAILNGVQLSAVTGVGTATIAALIGAGGYGSLIITGLSLNDLSLVMAGAAPSAVMALAMSLGLDLVTRFVVPRGLRARQ